MISSTPSFTLKDWYEAFASVDDIMKIGDFIQKGKQQSCRAEERTANGICS